MAKLKARPTMAWVDVATLSADPSNTRRHSARNLETIRASLLRFGQQKPIVVDAKGVVVAGNGTLEAARALGWTKLAVVRSDLKGADRTAYAIADNRTAELAAWDEGALSETLAALQNDEEYDHLVAGFTDAEIEALIGKAMLPDPAPQAEPVLLSEVLVEIRCTKAVLAGIAETLQEWSELDGCQVDIS